MEKLFAALSEIHPLSSAHVNYLKEAVIEERFTKNQILISEGRIIDRLYFIKEGFASGYFYNNNKKITSIFWNQGHFILLIPGFLRQKPSSEYVELLEDSKLLSISYKQFLEVLELFPEANYIIRTIIEEYEIHHEKRVKDLITLTAFEKYKQLLETSPIVFQKAPLISIASYLGISPETISRLRAKKHKLLLWMLMSIEYFFDTCQFVF